MEENESEPVAGPSGLYSKPIVSTSPDTSTSVGCKKLQENRGTEEQGRKEEGELTDLSELSEGSEQDEPDELGIEKDRSIRKTRGLNMRRMNLLIQNEIITQTGSSLNPSTKKQIAMCIHKDLTGKSQKGTPKNQKGTAKKGQSKKGKEIPEKGKEIQETIIIDSDEETEEKIQKGMRKTITPRSLEDIRKEENRILAKLERSGKSRQEIEQTTTQIKALLLEKERLLDQAEYGRRKVKLEKRTNEESQEIPAKRSKYENFCLLCQVFGHEIETCTYCTYCKDEKAGHTARWCKRRQEDKRREEDQNRERIEQVKRQVQHAQILEILRGERQRIEEEKKVKDQEKSNQKETETPTSSGIPGGRKADRLSSTTEGQHQEPEKTRNEDGDEGIFSKFYKLDQAKEERRYLRQLNFLLFQSINTPSKTDNHNRRTWNCLICKNQETHNMSKKAAIYHSRKAHGKLVPDTEDRDAQADAILRLRGIVRPEGYQGQNYPCFKLDCPFSFKKPLETYFHMRTEHTPNTEELLCFLCMHPLQAANIHKHWERSHLDLTCTDRKCFNVHLTTVTEYLAHINICHIDYLYGNLSSRTLLRVYRKCIENEHWHPSFPAIRALAFADRKNTKLRFPLYSRNFNRWIDNLPMGEDPFEIFMIGKHNEKICTEMHTQPIPSILLKVQEEMQKKTRVQDFESLEPLKVETPWLSIEAISPPFDKPFSFCGKCGDNEDHSKEPRQCVTRGFAQTLAPFTTNNADYNRMKLYAGLLLGTKEGAWGATPILPINAIYNGSDYRNNVQYATGRMGKIPIIFRQGEITTLETPDYFAHCRQVLETLREHVREPVLYEYFMCHETTCIEEQENNVRGYLEAFLQMKKEYPYTSFILAPVPKPEKNQTMSRYLTLLGKTKEITKILMAHAAALNVPVLPTEGYLYSSPQNKEMTKWKTFTGEGKGPLRNFDGSLTIRYLKRAGDLIEVVVQQFKQARSEYLKENPHAATQEEVYLEDLG
jgi:hypothetical protein